MRVLLGLAAEVELDAEAGADLEKGASQSSSKIRVIMITHLY
jgi:hypothetical protein